ncbi:hypothetical protein [Hydrogenovibrio halophilus]|uniref:hypothetical protein n=1 Tax=Hydrogenovibrio halophilus TaxID=373391 RepID=UPI0003A99434|nr:hypothetical protein [Hydrogenovibrio halophilus]
MKKLMMAMLATGILAGCANEAKTQTSAPAKTEQAQSVANNDDLYVAFHEGRMNVFYDAALYKEFIERGETAYRRTFIGAGPNGETVMYGLTGEDKKKTTPSIGEQMMSGDLKAAEDFYGEVYQDEENRIYVFSTWDDFKGYVDLGIDNLRYTDIGAGPNGETVVYVLNPANKKEKPVATIEKFKAFHGI